MKKWPGRHQKRKQSGAALQEYMFLLGVMVLALTPGILSFSGSLLKPLCTSNASLMSNSAVTVQQWKPGPGYFYWFSFNNNNGKPDTFCKVFYYDGANDKWVGTILWHTW